MDPNSRVVLPCPPAPRCRGTPSDLTVFAIHRLSRCCSILQTVLLSPGAFTNKTKLIAVLTAFTLMLKKTNSKEFKCVQLAPSATE